MEWRFLGGSEELVSRGGAWPKGVAADIGHAVHVARDVRLAVCELHKRCLIMSGSQLRGEQETGKTRHQNRQEFV